MYRTIFSIILFFFIQNSYTQTQFLIHKLSYLDFFETSSCDTNLLQTSIKQNIDDGEYYVFYNEELTKLWMHGIIYNDKLEGKWEIRDRNNVIIEYRMFVEGKEINIEQSENTYVKIYLPNKDFVYNAYYISTGNDTLTKNDVTLKITSQNYEILHSPRFEGVWDFHYSQDDSLLLGYVYPWNDWDNKTVCLITETQDQIQIYPPRLNQFVFTETIKFPSIIPSSLVIGHKWDNQIKLPENYYLKEWENTTFYHQSQIVGKCLYSFQNRQLECWIIKGTSFNQDFGTSFFEYLFNEEFGFVKMEWINYDKQKAIFELVDLKVR